MVTDTRKHWGEDLMWVVGGGWEYLLQVYFRIISLVLLGWRWDGVGWGVRYGGGSGWSV